MENKSKFLLITLVLVLAGCGAGIETDPDQGSGDAIRTGNPTRPRPDNPHYYNPAPTPGGPESLTPKQQLLAYLAENPELSGEIDNAETSCSLYNIYFDVEQERIDVEFRENNEDENICCESTSEFTINDDGILSAETECGSVSYELDEGIPAWSVYSGLLDYEHSISEEQTRRATSACPEFEMIGARIGTDNADDTDTDDTDADTDADDTAPPHPQDKYIPIWW